CCSFTDFHCNTGKLATTEPLNPKSWNAGVTGGVVVSGGVTSDVVSKMKPVNALLPLEDETITLPVLPLPTMAIRELSVRRWNDRAGVPPKETLITLSRWPPRIVTVSPLRALVGEKLPITGTVETGGVT